jgi:hypothetical protein
MPKRQETGQPYTYSLRSGDARLEGVEFREPRCIHTPRKLRWIRILQGRTPDSNASQDRIQPQCCHAQQPERARRIGRVEQGGMLRAHNMGRSSNTNGILAGTFDMVSSASNGGFAHVELRALQSPHLTVVCGGMRRLIKVQMV